MQTQTIYTNLSESVTLACEHCRRSKVLQAEVVKNLPQPLKVKCPCGATFAVHIVIRQVYRKKTRLPGVYVKRNPHTGKILEQGRMIVEDISRTGIGFHILNNHTLLLNDMLAITFTLDDKQQTNVQKSVRVRRIDHYFIGAEFLDHDAFTDTNRMLGFYLMPR